VVDVIAQEADMPRKAVIKSEHPNGQPVTFADIRLEYIMSSSTLADLAEKHGASMSTLMKRSASEGWEVERKNQAERIFAQAQEAAMSERAKALKDFNDADLGLSRALRSMVAKQINDARQTNANIDPKDLRALASTAAEAQRIGRLAMGVDTEITTTTTREIPTSINEFV